jgi:hypothetical protein
MFTFLTYYIQRLSKFYKSPTFAKYSFLESDFSSKFSILFRTLSQTSLPSLQHSFCSQSTFYFFLKNHKHETISIFSIQLPFSSIKPAHVKEFRKKMQSWIWEEKPTRKILSGIRNFNKTKNNAQRRAEIRLLVLF